MLIDAQHLRLTVDRTGILYDVSLHLEAGEIYRLLGPNGAGKSTTIALTLGLYTAAAGRLALFGEAGPTSLRRARARIGVMPQQAGFYDWMRAGDYLAWYAGFYEGLQQPIPTLLTEVGLGSEQYRLIGQFSRGMRQRLTLARALVHSPSLLILDEPTNGLDPRGRREIHDLLLISNAELSLLDNAQVVYMMTGTVTGAGAIIAVILGSDAFAGERERRTLAPLLTAPISTSELLMGKALGLITTWGVMYLLALPYLWAVGAGGQNLIQAMVYLVLFGTPVVLGFGYLAMALSARSGSVLTALLSGLIVLLFCASPLLIGPGLRNSAVGKTLDAVNPFAGALNTFDAVIIDSDPFLAQLPRLALVLAWLVLSFVAAHLAAGRPRFR
jgi:ABC-type Mn2+/Zn2+ transport system ATPase subunit